MVKLTPTPKAYYDETWGFLQEQLRPKDWPFAIAQEYPLVLSRSSDNQRSLSYISDHHIVCHMNFLPRSLTEHISIGFIGNVATDPKKRKQGFMKQAFEEIKDLARKKNLKALILWSELEEFYQKLGFQPFGSEGRCLLPKSFGLFPHPSHSFYRVDQLSFSLDLYEEIMELQPKVKGLTYKRTFNEFQTLLSIPETTLICGFEHHRLLSYGLIGKGFDMMGVLHEWGGRSIKDLQYFVGWILKVLQISEILLLTPWGCDLWQNLSANQKLSISEHPVGFAYPLYQDFLSNLDELYIWGLDSI